MEGGRWEVEGESVRVRVRVRGGGWEVEGEGWREGGGG